MVRAMIHHEIVTGDYSDNEKIRGYIAYIDSLEKNYRNKIIKYIEKYLDDTITLFPELVQKFNQNKLYNQIPNMKEHDILSFVAMEDAEDYYSMVVNEREEYLSRHGIVI